MAWIDKAVQRLEREPACGYASGDPPATEPTALAAMALTAHGRRRAARQALDWLAAIQTAKGSVGISARQQRPWWATGWALLAWRTALAARGDQAAPAWRLAADRAAAWLLATRGRRLPRSDIVGHDTQLLGWPWVEGTHSWLEPTAIALLGLKAAGLGQHARCREGVKLILDRQLPSSGWNYGNPVVLGEVLRPHMQPTGLALAALVGEPGVRGKIEPGLRYLHRALSPETPGMSLCYGLIGLAAHRQWPEQGQQWLEGALDRTLQRDGSPLKLALLALASQRERCVWFRGAVDAADSSAAVVPMVGGGAEMTKR